MPGRGHLWYGVVFVVAGVLTWLLVTTFLAPRQHYKDFGVAFADDAPVPSTVMGELQPVGPTKAGNDKVITPAGNVIVY
jgi:hypothetical protein